mmetsp:Transcript_43350/g.107672  ORF Transcript_43350/g.107672 Transcript_43350/m.107672 type:complete len:101 (-) Transcript_43350:367-669(-)
MPIRTTEECILSSDLLHVGGGRETFAKQHCDLRTCGHRFHKGCLHRYLAGNDSFIPVVRLTRRLVYTIDSSTWTVLLILHDGWPTGLVDVEAVFHRRFPR